MSAPVPAGAAPVSGHAEALRSPEQLLRLRAHALDATLGLVPASMAVFATVTPRFAIADAVVLDVRDPARTPVAQWRRYLAEGAAIDPFAPRRVTASSATVLTLADLGDGGSEFARYLARTGYADELAIYLRRAGTVIAVIWLLRTPAEEPFSRAEALAARRIQPLIEHAYLCGLTAERPPAQDALYGCGLTAREVAVAELVGRGAGNAEIARALDVSMATVKTHLTRIYSKVGVRSRTQLAILVSGAAKEVGAGL